ncbi:MAG: rod shape-determining protein RodA [Alphaproteobacteria bacterium]|nr:rod shape-determining protein RodA [Alphaproteobacteria bacterium]
MTTGYGLKEVELTLAHKLWNTSWFLLFLLGALAAVGVAMLYSAADGSFEPWAWRHLIRFAIGIALLFLVALVDIRFWLRSAYLLYAGAFVLLAAVEVMGAQGMGAQRWVDLGGFRLQPSELMKIALVVALARYFHGLTTDQVRRLPYLLVPAALVAAPAALVLRQPDLGTAVMLGLGGGAIFLVAGVRLWVLGLGGGLAVLSVPVAWQFMHAYQKQRIFTFLNPESDPLGAGYHILQSKIALGSGGLFGKGFLQGTQSHLNFLPEKQTDFIFTTLSEEFGIVGGLLLLSIYALVLAYALLISVRSHNQFGRLLGMGVSVTFFLYVFINIAMVTGLVPVVGVPLPLVSYGGSAMVTLLIGFGLVMNVHIHREIMIPRRPGQLVV